MATKQEKLEAILPDRMAHIVLHALGCPHKGGTSTAKIGGWRNHFSAGGTDVALCDRLVRLGWMRPEDASVIGVEQLYRVSEAGKTVLRLLGWKVEDSR